MERVRRISTIFAAMALGLPFVPLLAGSPSRGCFGFRAGSDTCGMFSLALMVAALVGIARTQSVLPARLRRWTLPKAVGVGILWIVLANGPV